MGYNYEIEKSAGSELILVPDDGDTTETYPIEQDDIAEMIREMFYDSATRFTRDNLVEALELYDAKKTPWQAGLFYLIDELALALEAASAANKHNGGWNPASPFQDKINDLLVQAGRQAGGNQSCGYAPLARSR